LPKDYVRLRLTGEHAIDAADASGTLLFDVAGRRWSQEVCAALEIPAEWLPPAHESTAIGGAGDQAAAALGIGITAPGPVSVVLGTSGVVFGVLPEYAPDAQARVHVFCHAVPGTWHAMGVMLSAAGSAAWLRHALAADLATLDGEAAGWEPGAEGLLFAPYLAGERTPHADANARGAFTGLSVRHDRGALWRAMLEGVAYGLRDSLELLRRAQRALAAHRFRRARLAARADGLGGRIGLRRGAPRGCAIRRLCRRGRRRISVRARARPDRARPRLGRRLRPRLRPVPHPLPRAAPARGAPVTPTSSGS
jgi:xylulokinase